MGPTFRRIRRLLERRLQRLYDRAQDTKINLMRRSIERLRQEEHSVDPAEFKALDEGIKQLEMQSRMALCANVGQALSVWAQMEEALVGIACILLETKNEKAGIVMYSIINFNVWTTVIEELFQMDGRFDALIPKWNKISSKLRSLKNIRDNLAHHTIGLADPATASVREVLLGPAPSDTRRQSQRHQPLDYEKISAFQDSVVAVVESLSTLLIAMAETLSRAPLLQKFSEQAPGRPPP